MDGLVTCAREDVGRREVTCAWVHVGRREEGKLAEVAQWFEQYSVGKTLGPDIM